MSLATLTLLLALAPADGGPIVVVPPQGPADGLHPWIGALVAETLPRALQRAGVSAVPDADRRRVQEALGVPAAATTRATSIRVAEALGASRLVVGTWEESGANVILSLRLLDLERGALSAPLAGSAPLTGLGGLVHSLAWDVALAATHPPTGTREGLLRAGSAIRFEAWQALGEGLAAREAAARLAGVRRALAADPSFEEAALVLARLLADTGTFEPARAVLSRLAPQSPFAREARFLDGVALLGLKRYAEADVLYAGLVATQATAPALANRAIARLRLGHAKGASALLRQAVEAEPASTDLPFDLGWALLGEGDTRAAAFWLKGVTRRDPGDAQARLLLSWALGAGGQTAEGEEQWKAAAALAPALAPLRVADLSRPFERVFVSEHALVLDPERREDAEESRGHAARGEALLAGSDLAGAVSELTRASLLDPYAPTPHRLLARAQHGQGQDQQAIEQLEMALFCREDPVVRRELADLLRATGRSEEAKRVLGPP